VLLGQVEEVDPLLKRVLLADGATFEYDSLILATGSQTSYYGHAARVSAARVRYPRSDAAPFAES
jgi:NADH dehydrogenase FAD-containing subunit